MGGLPKPSNLHLTNRAARPPNLNLYRARAGKGPGGLRARPSAKDASPLVALDYGDKSSVKLFVVRTAGHGCQPVRVSVRTYPHRVAPGWVVGGRTPLPPPPYTCTRYPPVGVPVGGCYARLRFLTRIFFSQALLFSVLA